MSTHIETILDNLCAEANSSVEARLRAMHKTIKGFKRNHVDLTAPNLISALGALGISMSKSSIYNKKIRGKDNPYRVLVDGWSKDINETKIKQAESNTKVDFTIMTNSDYESISSDVVKFKVQNMYSELRSARHQINLLKDIQALPLIEDKGDTLCFHRGEKSVGLSKSSDGASLNNYEAHIDVLEDFLAGNSKLSFDDEGGLVASKGIRKGDALSDIELQHALIAALDVMKR
ncbi:gamma-mobile-trio protein GmtX [Alteromonas stellipolaris]|uniref:gamma-mobile-trio protein GmtX n=1 Tax=Alteromonas stellipolaris TaxID=233316 RepID=UPI0024958319|nr:gamma-mobile-trio protein GmtX [Alteromonas stellipolaris]